MKDVIIAPLSTEKSRNLRVQENKYVFKVALKAKKQQIKKEIERMFEVKVEKVSTSYVRGKLKRVRFKWGRTPRWKKGIVTLKKGEKIDIFGEV
jgi:large subunit ribosomal protein L23